MNHSIFSKKSLKICLVLIFSLLIALGGPLEVNAQTVHAKDKLTDKISGLLSEIQNLQKQLAEIPSPGFIDSQKCVFERDIYLGLSGDDVKCLQQYLFETGHIKTELNVTGYFGPITKSALGEWQEENDINPPAGYFGSISRSFLISNTTSISETGVTETKVLTNGTELTVLLGVQNSNATAPLGAARIPLLKLILGAGTDGNILVKSLKFKGETLSTQSSLLGVFISDDEGNTIGSAKNFGGNLEVVFDSPFIVNSGSVKVINVFGNRAFHTTGSGESIKISLVNVDAGPAKILGRIPVTGPEIKVNTSLPIGGVLFSGGSDASVVGTEIPGEQKKLLSFKLQNNDREKVRFKKIRFIQSGSIEPKNLSNVYLVINSDRYEVKQIPGSNYFSSEIDLVINEGGSLDATLIADIVGGSGKTISFGVASDSDVWLDGMSSGYSILSRQRGLATEGGWYQSRIVKISKGSAIFNNAEEKDRNIAVNVANQSLASFSVGIYGEPVALKKITFSVSSDNSTSHLISNVILEGPNGVLAGPVDQVGSDITFNSVVFPTGTGTYLLKGTVVSDLTDNRDLIISAEPSSWSAEGVETKESISINSKEKIVGGVARVRSASILLSTSSIGVERVVDYSGGRNIVLASYNFDASGSGEDIRVKSFNAELSMQANNKSVLRNCRLFDGETLLNSGANIVYPKDSVEDRSFYTFVLDKNIIIPKGKEKSIELKCDVNSVQNKASFSWGIPETNILINALGVVSGKEALFEIGEIMGPEIVINQP